MSAKRPCPCGGAAYTTCCEPFLIGKALPPTPLHLMRSRYTAFYFKKIRYISLTQAHFAATHFNFSVSKKWARGIQLTGLKILSAPQVPLGALEGTVHFKAYYIEKTQNQSLEENSQFLWRNNQWFYTGRAL